MGLTVYFIYYVLNHFHFAEVTLTTLNVPEQDVDIESIGQPGTKKPKLEFDSGNFRWETVKCNSWL